MKTVTRKQLEASKEKAVRFARNVLEDDEIALNILIAGLTLIFLLAVVTLQPFAIYTVASATAGTVPSVAVLISLLVCLIPTQSAACFRRSASPGWTA